MFSKENIILLNFSPWYHLFSRFLTLCVISRCISQFILFVWIFVSLCVEFGDASDVKFQTACRFLYLDYLSFCSIFNCHSTHRRSISANIYTAVVAAFIDLMFVRIEEIRSSYAWKVLDKIKTARKKRLSAKYENLINITTHLIM